MIPKYQNQYIFEKVDDKFIIRKDLKALDLQDPCITIIDNEYVVGGTYVYEENNSVFWYTKFYKGKDLNQLEPSLNAPLGMKDVRLLELDNHKIAVFTRPQGKKRWSW